MVGELGASGFMLEAKGTSDVSQAAADSQALSALNGQRKQPYAGTVSYGRLADRRSALKRESVAAVHV
jgi:hypothetical protein